MKKLMTLLLMALMMTCLQAQSKVDLQNVILEDLNGNSVDVGGLMSEGNPLVLFFWSTWCKSPCVSVLENLNDKYSAWKKETGVRVLSISIDDSRSSLNVKPFVEGKGWDFDVLLDTDGDLKKAVGVSSPPYVILLDGNGKIVYRQGYSDDMLEMLYDNIKQENYKE